MLTLSSLYAQFRLGVKGGINYTTIGEVNFKVVSEVPQPAYQIGYNAGITSAFQYNEVVSFRGEFFIL